MQQSILESRYKGLTGVKMDMGEVARQDLLLFGDSTGPDSVAPEEDAWIGLAGQQQHQPKQAGR